jgi:parallel beta-helix repeat protein
MIRGKRLLLLATIAWPLSALADTYVSPKGLDTNLGTAAAPFLTIQRAADLATAGTTVWVADGTYAGFKPSNQGTATAPIRFVAQGSGAVINKPSAKSDTANVHLTSYSTLEGFTVTGGTEWGVRFSETTGAVIRKCTVTKATEVNIYGGHATSTLIEDNEVSYAVNQHGIYLANSSTGAIIRHNHIHHNAVAGFHLNGDISQPPGDGVIRGVTIERNTIHDNQQNGINMDGVQDSVIRNNLIYDNQQNGIRAYVIDAGQGPKGLTIVNNTILVPLGAGGWCVRITEDLGGNLVRNCILLSADPQRGSIALDDTKGFASDHNLVIDRFTPDRDDTILTLAQWQAKGYDSGSALSSAAALFVTPGSDFHLKTGCAAIDKGNSQLAPTNDLDGKARPQGAGVDIGCFEFGASLPPGDASRRDGALVADAAGTADGARPREAGAIAERGATGDGARPGEGCSCRLHASRSTDPTLLLVLVIAVIAGRRRRCSTADRTRCGRA